MAQAATGSLLLSLPQHEAFEAVTLKGKFLAAGDEKLFIRGVTYGPLRPGPDGCGIADRTVVGPLPI